MWDGVREAYAMVWHFRSQFIRIVWAWLVVYSLTLALTDWFDIEPETSDAWWLVILPSSLDQWVYYFCMASIAVA